MALWNQRAPKLLRAEGLSCLFQALSPLSAIWFFARLMDELGGSRDPGHLAFWAALALGCAALLSLIGSLLNRWARTEDIMSYWQNERTFADKMMQLDYADVDRQEVYDLYSRIRQNARWSMLGMQQALALFQPMMAALMQSIGGIGLSVTLFTARVPEKSALSFLNHPLAGAAVPALLVGITLLVPLIATKRDRYWMRFAQNARMGNRVYSFYGFMAQDRKRALDIRMYDQQKQICGPMLELDDGFGPQSQIAHDARGPMGVLTMLEAAIGAVVTIVVYLFVCLKAYGGAFGVGAVTQYVGAVTSLFLGFSALLNQLGLMRNNTPFLRETFEFLDLPNTMYQGSLTTEKRSDRQYEVELRDVSFRYPGSESWALRHVNMKFRVGSRLAVVGKNGSGKTTFIKLLCRLYDPTEGQILLNGIDIRKYRYADYIRIFSVVFQDFQLLALPLGENVAGAADYDRTRATDCLNKAGFTDRLAGMPLGLDTYLYKDLEKEGVEISGGEAQKIAIARSLYRDAPFIILDEPTAALDPLAEAEIYAKFKDIAGDKTAIYISHRLSSCKFCDEIAVFDEGQVVQQGTHDQLLAAEDGLDHALWHAQAQYYAQEAAKKAAGEGTACVDSEG